MQTSLFDFHLPEQNVAQQPLPKRDQSRLLVIDRANKTWRDEQSSQLASYFKAGDVLILNNTRVIPARLRAIRDSSGGKVEFLLVPEGADEALHSAATEPAAADAPPVTIRRALVKSGGKRLVGDTFTLTGGMKARIIERCGEAGDRIEFQATPEELAQQMDLHGEIPLPPYIRRPAGPSTDYDRRRYQTVFALTPGAVAAPTAGLHFTENTLEALQAKGVECRYVTLHVGPGTFRPVKADKVEDHFVDPEPYVIPAETARAIARAKAEGRRVVAVGSTSLRTLEGAADQLLALAQGAAIVEDLRGQTSLFIYPPAQFRIVDAMLTNFHVPKSSLLMLICAFASPGQIDGIKFIKAAYAHAIAEDYRFYSYGDACLLL